MVSFGHEELQAGTNADRKVKLDRDSHKTGVKRHRTLWVSRIRLLDRVGAYSVICESSRLHKPCAADLHRGPTNRIPLTLLHEGGNEVISEIRIGAIGVSEVIFGVPTLVCFGMRAHYTDLAFSKRSNDRRS